MATYYAIYDIQSLGYGVPEEPTFGEAKILTAPEGAKVIKLEASSVTEARRTLNHFYEGDLAHQSVIVETAAWQEGSS